VRIVERARTEKTCARSRGERDRVDLGYDFAWLALGLLGNTVFSARFLVQWLASERAGISIIPRAFWHLSLVGSALLLAYAVHRRDPVFVLANLPSAAVYLRNLALLRAAERAR
jgi:lipid-A-disaccharide synthase-like uncharacterized protein